MQFSLKIKKETFTQLIPTFMQAFELKGPEL